MKLRKKQIGASQISPSQFRKLFLDRAPVDSVACWEVADPLIIYELKKLIKGAPNDFINLVEYLADNAEDNSKAFRIHNLIHEAYGFVGRYADAWDAAKYRKISAAWHFDVYRRVLPDLDLPARSIAQHVPRASRHWRDNEVDEIYDVLESLLQVFKSRHGVSLYEHYSRIEDSVLESVQRTTGISFDIFKSSYKEFSVKQIRELRETSPILTEALRQQLTEISRELSGTFESENELQERKRSAGCLVDS